MMLLPKKVGPFTLMRKLDADGTTEAYVGILDEPAGKQVVARRVPPPIARDATRMDRVKARVGDLMGVRHPSLVTVLDLVEADGDYWILEDWSDAVDLGVLIRHCARAGSALPHNVYLSLATQICNGLEALHSRPGKESGAEHVLHMALTPSAILLTPDGRILLGDYGLSRSPASAGSTVTGTFGGQMEYLSPEQTHQDQKLSPASDIFSLGTVLFELLTTRPMFRAESNLQTIHRVRRAEVTTQLLEVKEVLPGLDKVLFRALSLNPRHRYQRAFVLREDLRGLMAGFSFSDIEEVTVAFLNPILRGARGGGSDELVPSLGPDGPAESTAALLAGASPTPGILSAFDPMGEVDTDLHSRRFELDTDPGPPTDGDLEADTLGGRGDTAWVPQIPRPDASAPPLTRRPLEDVHTSEGYPPGRPEEESSPFDRSDTFPRMSIDGMAGEPTTGPLLEHSTSLPFPGPTPMDAPARGDTIPFDETAPTPLGLRPHVDGVQPNTTAAFLRDQDTLTSPGDTTMPVDLDQQTMPSARPQPVIVPSEPTPPPPLRRPEPATTPLQQLAPPDALLPPPSERPPPARKPLRSEPKTPLFDDDDEPQRPAWVPLAVGGAAVAAVLGLLVCVGVGGSALGLIAAGTTDADGVVAEAPAPAEDPKVPEPEPEPRVAVAAPVQPDPVPVRPDPVPVRPDPVPVRPDPVPVRPDPVPVRPDPVPVRPDPVVVRPDPVPVRPPPPEPVREAPTPQETWDAVAMVDSSADLEPAGDVGADDLAAWSTDAFAGRLSPDSSQALAAVTADDPGFTRARTLLYLDAKARGDDRTRQQHLTLLMTLPENQYNPVLLVEEAQDAVARRDFETALERARTAEQHWARMPSDLIYSRKALIYEIEALSHTGLFYDSEGDDLDELAQAIRGWERYRRHVETKDRKDLLSRADQNLDKLYEIQRRVE